MSKFLQKQVSYLLTSWMMAVTLEYMLLPQKLQKLEGLSGIAQMSGLRVICITAAFVLLWNILHGRLFGRWTLVFTFAVYASSAVTCSFNWGFFAACILVLLIISGYAVFGWERHKTVLLSPQKEGKLFAILVGVGALAFFCFVSAWTVARVNSFSTPSFDFGIFSQMFYSMRKTGFPMTTLERDGLLSHFAVHVSPVYYLMLPFYCLVPRPETLQVLQAAIMTSALIPLWKLGKLHGLSPVLRGMVCGLMLLFPAFAGGAGYDLHENCFLTVLLLWVFYGMDRKNGPITAILALLTLMVKEDAAVYVAVIGLYFLLRCGLGGERWGSLAGGILMVAAIGWFVAVTAYLSRAGDGVMSYRYKNFMYDGSDSLLTVVKAVLLCPMKAVFECVDNQKLSYIGLTMFPLLGLPLLTRRYERYLLMIPYFLVNLMTDYRYQYDIMYQYSFGSTSFLFYLVVVNLSDFKIQWKKLVLTGIALSISFGCFCGTILPTAAKYISYAQRNADFFEQQRSALNTIPEDASVAATTFYTTYLSERDILFDVRYGSLENILGCEYIVLKVSESGSYKNYAIDGENGKENFVTLLLENGFALDRELEGVLEIYRKSPER